MTPVDDALLQRMKAAADPDARPLDRPEAIEQVGTLLAAVRRRLAQTGAG